MRSQFQHFAKLSYICYITIIVKPCASAHHPYQTAGNFPRWWRISSERQLDDMKLMKQFSRGFQSVFGILLSISRTRWRLFSGAMTALDHTAAGNLMIGK